MALMSEPDRRFAEAVSDLAYCNPFLSERIDYERASLGHEFVETRAQWNLYVEVREVHPNVSMLLTHCEALVERIRTKLDKGEHAQRRELNLYEDLVIFLLYYRYREDFSKAIEQTIVEGGAGPDLGFFHRFAAEADRFFAVGDLRLPTDGDLAHLFACFFQVKRAFRHIFRHIVGRSKPAARFRASIWQSIFTHNMHRYRRVMYDRMASITTLISGPSGTGKELAARAIGMSRHIPFDPKTGSFIEDFATSFCALNPSALPQPLIESELFGHLRGSFTGAIKDRKGWLEVCPALGTVFLDEIGDVDPSIQVKLLRVVQSRTFQRIGDTRERRFHGKIIAATNRDLSEDIRSGRFREDFYYRLCSDLVVAPTLREQLEDNPEDLRDLVLFITKRLVEEDADSLADEVVEFIKKNLGEDYLWEGNVRELEQCVRNILVRGEYHPRTSSILSIREELGHLVSAGQLTVKELLRRYCTLVYATTGSYQQAASTLDMDRRSVKTRIDPELLERLRKSKRDSG